MVAKDSNMISRQGNSLASTDVVLGCVESVDFALRLFAPSAVVAKSILPDRKNSWAIKAPKWPPVYPVLATHTNRKWLTFTFKIILLHDNTTLPSKQIGKLPAVYGSPPVAAVQCRPFIE